MYTYSSKISTTKILSFGLRHQNLKVGNASRLASLADLSQNLLQKDTQGPLISAENFCNDVSVQRSVGVAVLLCHKFWKS